MDPPRAPRAPRRVATAPITVPVPAIELGSTAGVETLYSHPHVKIISFEAHARRARDAEDIEGLAAAGNNAGTLPWTCSLERIIAVGAFRVYRAPGSVAFLSCGSALQPILPKSQCWCVDEDDSKFVLQIRRPAYWRIELPVSTPDERVQARIFRDVLANALQFEKTRCPFRRSFTVALPQSHAEPAKKRPWTPRLLLDPAGTMQPPGQIGTCAPAVRASASSPPSGHVEEDSDCGRSRCRHPPSASDRQVLAPCLPSQLRQDSAVISPSTHTDLHVHGWQSAELEYTPSFRVTRSYTTPADLRCMLPSPLELAPTHATEKFAEPSPEPSQAGSYDSFHSIESLKSSCTPGCSSPHGSCTHLPHSSTYDDDNSASNDDTHMCGRSGSCGNASRQSTGCDEFFDMESSNEDMGDSTSVAVSRLRARRRDAGGKSRHIHAEADATGGLAGHFHLKPGPDRGGSVKRLPLSLLSKTCELLLGPPTQLITLMLKVAAKICAGEWRGRLEGYGEGGQHIPVQWDYSAGEMSDWTDDDDDDDDAAALALS